MNKDYVGTYIKGRRIRLGWSQSELSRRCGITSAAISKIEKFNLNPNIESARKIAEAFKISINELYGEIDTDYLSEEKKFYINFSDITKLCAEDKELILTLLKRLLESYDQFQ